MNDNKQQSSTEDPIDQFKNIVDEVEQKGEQISDVGQTIQNNGQYMVDIARATRGVIAYLPPNVIENLISDWKPLAQQAGNLLVGLQGIKNDAIPSTDSLAGTATISITGSFSNSNPYVYSGLLNSNPQAELAVSNLHAVAGRLTDFAKTKELLLTLGFDNASKGKQSPLELFTTAHGSFERPVSKENPIITSLIPMRECIRLVIDDLLKRKPMQEVTKGDYAKIISIGRHLKRDAVPIDTFESLARTWHEEIRDKELSDAKEAYIDRDEWLHRLQRATQFLFSLLSGLDPAKMKKR